MSLFDFVFVLKSLATLQSFLTEISSFDVWICSRSSIHFTCNASDKPSSSSQQEKKKNGVFFDSISQFNFFFVCLWQIVPFLSITTTGPMGTKVEIYIRLQFEKSKHVCVQNLFFFFFFFFFFFATTFASSCLFQFSPNFYYWSYTIWQLDCRTILTN